jgi:hypothetical protein
MGATNVSLAYLRWAQLPDRPFRLLTFMSLISLDTDMPPRFWGGYPSLARALGRKTPDHPQPDATAAQKKARNADFEAVRIGMKVLTDESAITILVPGAPGRNPIYGLNLVPNAPGGTWGTPQAQPGDAPGMAWGTPQAEPGTEEGTPLRGVPNRGLLGTFEETRSPNVTTSPANSAAEIEARYSAAMTFLNTLPDLGQELMTHIPAELSPRERVILAAEMASTERNVS